jgi:hypothetical protein
VTRFVFADTLPAGRNGWYAAYDHARLDAPGWTACEVRATVTAHQDGWFDDLDAWHGALCEEGARRARDFWLTSISRLNVWTQEPVLKPLFFAAGLCQWAAVHPEADTIVVLRAPAEVAAYVGEFTKDASAPAARTGSWRAALTGLAAMAGRLVRLADHARRRPVRARARVLVYSQVVDGQALDEVGDHFFGRYVDDLARGLAGEVAVAYLLRDAGDRGRVERSLGAGPARAFFLLDHLRAADLVRIAIRTVRTCLALASLPDRLLPLTIGPHTSRRFAGAYVAAEALRRTADVEIAVAIAMRRALAATGATTLLYPYEEKGLERALLRARDGAGGPVRALGFGHAAHSRCHLALRTRTRGTAPAPDALLATGARAARFLVEWGRKDPTRVAAVGSPRSLAPGPAPRPRAERARGLRVLVVIAHASELDALGAWLERAPRLLDGHEVVIRTYRFGWFAEQERGLRRVLAVAPALVPREGALSEQLAWADLVIFNSTTTGVQAMLAGRLAVHAALHDLFAVDPLLGEPGVFARCAGPADLASVLARAREMDDADVAAVIAAQRRVAATILAPPDPDALLRVVRGADPMTGSTPR